MAGDIQALPRQAEDQGVELLLRQLCAGGADLYRRPDKASLIEAARGTPYAKAVMHQ